MTIDNLKSKAIKGAGFNVIAQFVGLIFNTASVIILARLLTPKDFGLVAMITAFSNWFMNFGENGFTEFIIQKKDISYDEVNSIFWLHVFMACFLAIGFTLFGFYLVQFYSEPTLWGIAAAMSTSFVFVAFSTSPLAILKREMKFKPIAILGLVAVILSIVFAISAAICGMSYWAIVIRQISIIVVPMIGAWILCSWRPSYPKITHALPGFKYALKVYGSFSLTYIMRNVDKVLLGKFHGTDVLGNYDRAYQLSMIPSNNLLTPLHNVALATLSRLTNDKEKFISYYTKAIGMVAFLGTAAALILTLSAHDIIYLLLGQEWMDAGPVVMAFGPGIAAMFIYGTHSWLHLSLGTPNRWLRWNILSSIFIIIAFAIAAPYGAVAMASAYSATAYILVIPALWYAGQPIGFSALSVFGFLWAYFASALVVFISWSMVSNFTLFLNGQLGNIHLILKIFFVSIIALFFYVGLVTLFQKSFRSIREIIEILTLFLHRPKD